MTKAAKRKPPSEKALRQGNHRKKSRALLATYDEKRNFRATPEPRGAITNAQGYTFVIQKHAATRLHYDFRLEWDGVLKSWAVPKEPVMDPDVKRLAVQTEDHPIAYGTFSGDIPKGHYGAGHVDIWDHGTWEAVTPPTEGLKSGKLTFVLHGERLSGEWTLIRTKGDEEKSQWLLMKHRENSDQTAQKQTEKKPSRKTPVDFKKKLDPLSFKPALCQLVDQIPLAKGWIHETKFDGYRIIAVKQQDRVQLMTRNQLDWSGKFNKLQLALDAHMQNGDVLDGEVVVLDAKGKSNFRLLQQALSNEDTSQGVFYVFDVLMHRFRDVRKEQLGSRKATLEAMAQQWPKSGSVRLSPWIEENSDKLFASACKLGLEGLVSKRLDSIYPEGRSTHWVKTKCLHEEEFLIVGYTEPEGNRVHFGALLLAQKADDGTLVYRGKVGTGFNDRDSIDLFKRFQKLKSMASPFHKALPPIARNTRIHWLKPVLIAQVQYSEQTDVGVLRHSSFLGLSEDKLPSQVKIETPKSIEVEEFQITNPEKIMYKKSKTTKQDLLHYYQQHADWILPFIKRRPLSLTRCPDGAGGACFFQRNDRGMFPKELHHKQKGGDALMWVEDVKGLLTLVQFGVLEIHTWGCHVETPTKPDIMVFDLDPGPGVAFKKLVEAAEHVKQFLDAMDLRSFVKTSGKKGLHICVPIEPTLPWDDIKQFTKQVAVSLEQRFPKLYTSKVTKATRQDKIFIDYLRNQRSATFIAPYSTRIADEPTVSMPIHWNELRELKQANAFSIDTSLQAPMTAWPEFFEVQQKVTKNLLAMLLNWAKTA